MPKPGDFEHGQAQGALRAAIGSARPLWWLALSVRTQFDAKDIFLPDIAGWRKDRHPERPSGRPVLVIPDWVCEVLPDSSQRRDLREKLPVYHRRRVDHVWLVDLDGHLVQVLRWMEPGYVLVHVAGVGDTLRAEPFDAIEIDVADLFGVPTPEPAPNA